MTHHIRIDIQNEQIMMFPAFSIPCLFRRERKREEIEGDKEGKRGRNRQQTKK